ncbi:MAG: hypothetical protein BroJett002_30900 [Candidatus Brocadia sinica]|nr:MAG: hypothetical protein BroJett002_30900 [Candidatus Brocadia sinica]
MMYTIIQIGLVGKVTVLERGATIKILRQRRQRKSMIKHLEQFGCLNEEYAQLSKWIIVDFGN